MRRLEQIFKSLDESPKGKKCAGMEGLVQEGSEVMEEDFEGARETEEPKVTSKRSRRAA